MTRPGDRRAERPLTEGGQWCLPGDSLGDVSETRTSVTAMFVYRPGIFLNRCICGCDATSGSIFLFMFLSFLVQCHSF